MRVVLPEPLGPTIAVLTPLRIWRSTWSRIFLPPRRTVASSMWRSRGVLSGFIFEMLPRTNWRWGFQRNVPATAWLDRRRACWPCLRLASAKWGLIFDCRADVLSPSPPISGGGEERAGWVPEL